MYHCWNFITLALKTRPKKEMQYLNNLPFLYIKTFFYLISFYENLPSIPI